MKTDKSVWAISESPVAWIRGSRIPGPLPIGKFLMASFPYARKLLTVVLVASAATWAGAQGSYAPEGGEYNIAGVLPGDQLYPSASIKASGGYLVWQDNITDGSGFGISARKLDGSLSGNLSTFRVNQIGAEDQENSGVTLLNDGSALFVWQGGKLGFQHIYGRVLSAAGSWNTGDLMLSTATNASQISPVAATLGNGNVVAAWNSFNQASSSSLQDVYFQILTPTGAKFGGETLANQAIAFNQRSVSLAALSDGRFIMIWISEQQRFENSVDVYGRIFSATGVPAGSEFLVSAGTNVCANPTVAASTDGGFIVAWMQRDILNSSNGLDIYARTFSGAAIGGPTRRVNTTNYGDQLRPKLAAQGSDFFVVWTSMAQDGSGEGVYGQYLAGDGALVDDEFRVNSTTVSRQIDPTVASDGVGRFLTIWASFVGGTASHDLYAQRYVNLNEPLAAPGAPIVSALSSNTLAVSWPPVGGLNISAYEVFADGAATATASVTNTYWNATGLGSASTHSYRLAYVLEDGRRSPLSAATTNTTYIGGATWGGIPQEWMIGYFGNDIFAWPSPSLDADGDGASNFKEFLAGTNPTDGASVLKVRLEATVQGLFLNWNTQSGLMYQVWSSSGASGPWSQVGGPRFAAGSVDSMYVGGNGSGFYQIQRLR